MLASLASLALLLSSPAHADLDVAFVLDTTGSMAGEIREAKSRVRELAEALSAARPNETIRLGVVAYRDKGDAYVTQVSPLTDQITVTHRFLEGLSANGGGDGPEHVIEGIRVALEELDWSQGAERQLFLIADAPAHTDYEGTPSLAELAAEAAERKVVINAIGCRSLSGRGIDEFRTLAYATEGQYHHIGRVQADAGGLADAMLQTLAPAPGEDGALRPIALYESRTGPSVDVDHPLAAGVLVRLGAWYGPMEREAELPGQACSLTVMVPAGMALARPPELAMGDRRLHATVALTAGEGARTVWELETCIPTTTPVEAEIY